MVATDEMLSESMPPGQRRWRQHRTADIVSAPRRRNASISSAASVVNSVVSLCRRGGENRFLFLDQCSLTIEDATDPTGLYEGGSSFQNYSNSQL